MSAKINGFVEFVGVVGGSDKRVAVRVGHIYGISEGIDGSGCVHAYHSVDELIWRARESYDELLFRVDEAEREARKLPKMEV
jgi:hypothetical protein